MPNPRAKFRELPVDQQLTIARRFLSAARFAGGSYDAVEGQTSRQRAPSIIELGNEDDILTPYKRGKLTNLMRQQLRNAPMALAVTQQRRVNVVGLCGGKLTLTAPGDEFAESNKAWQDWFNTDWAPQAEFTDELHFNELLKLDLATEDSTGDLVLMFDDGPLGDTGRIRAFETDEIANLKPSEFKVRFAGLGYTQSQGRIYDRLGRAVGVVVSAAQRGLTEFDHGKCFVLTRDMSTDKRDCHWIFRKRNFRFNQGRGVSPSSATAAPLTDIYEVTASETQATKINSKLFGQILDSSELPEGSTVPPEYRPTESDPNGETALTDEEAAELPAELADDSPPAVTFEQFDAIGAFYDLMPPKLKMELMDTKRPNLNIVGFIDFLSGQVTTPFGLSRLYASLTPDTSYTAFRGAQCLSQPSFEEASKDLERGTCDWAVRNAIRWGQRTGRLDAPVAMTLHPRWYKYCTWQWPTMPEVNVVDAATALQKQLANFETNYRERFGAKWQEKLQQGFDEVAFFRSAKVLHPAEQTVSGGVAAPAGQSPTTRGSDNETPKV